MSITIHEAISINQTEKSEKHEYNNKEMSSANYNVKTNYGKARTGGFALIMPWLIRIVSILLPHNFHKKKASLTGKF